MTTLRVCACLLVVALAGCAGQPRPAPEALQPEPAKAQAQHTDDVTKPGEVNEDTVMAAQMAGYKIVRENGQTMYCKRQKQTGSHLRQKTMCLTKQEWERLSESTRQTLDDMARHRLPPPRN